jgi:hypothetical protein
MGREEPRPTAGRAHGTSADKARAGTAAGNGTQPASRAEPKASTRTAVGEGGPAEGAIAGDRTGPF